MIPSSVSSFAVVVLTACGGSIGIGDEADKKPASLDAGVSAVDATPDAMVELLPAPCDDGDQRVFDETTGHCYLRFNDNVTWPEAKAACEATDAHLVSFASAIEEAFVTGISNNSGRWIGFTDSAVENTFAWVTAESVVYDNWDNGEPDDSGGEDCAIYDGGSGSWKDRECDQNRGYFCEREPQAAFQ